jgi:hypothetical protein
MEVAFHRLKTSHKYTPHNFTIEMAKTHKDEWRLGNGRIKINFSIPNTLGLCPHLLGGCYIFNKYKIIKYFN